MTEKLGNIIRHIYALDSSVRINTDDITGTIICRGYWPLPDLKKLLDLLKLRLPEYGIYPSIVGFVLKPYSQWKKH